MTTDMTTAEKLASVEAQIRKDIPRLMEVRQGCILFNKITNHFQKVYLETQHFVLLNNLNITYLDFHSFRKNELDDFEIIGHDIMLNDVLEWLKCLGFLSECSSIYSDGESFCREELVYDNDDNFLYKKTTCSDWYLPSPYLKDQSEELINFLYNIKNQ